MVINKICNICQSEEFIDFRGRILAQCARCKSLERHRLVHWTLDSLGYLDGQGNDKRVFQLAPERPTFRYMSEMYKSSYICSDLTPSRYPYAQCLKLSLPEGFDIFPDNYFDLILHNHVLEHIPGDYAGHLDAFLRILRPGGHMVFTVPPVYMDRLTVQDGENLPSDEDRIRLHGQSDHYKTFGSDFVDWFQARPDGEFSEMAIPENVRQMNNTHRSPVWVFKKSTLEP